MSRKRGTERILTVALLMSVVFAAGSAGWLGRVYYKRNHPPVLTCNETVYDFGQVSMSDAVQTHAFALKNATGQPVEVIAVQVECASCMNVDWSKRIVERGETVALQASLLPSALEGHVEKRLRLYFQGNNRPLVLTLVADVAEDPVPELRAITSKTGSEELGDTSQHRRAAKTEPTTSSR